MNLITTSSLQGWSFARVVTLCELIWKFCNLLIFAFNGILWPFTTHQISFGTRIMNFEIKLIRVPNEFGEKERIKVWHGTQKQASCKNFHINSQFYLNSHSVTTWATGHTWRLEVVYMAHYPRISCKQNTVVGRTPCVVVTEPVWVGTCASVHPSPGAPEYFWLGRLELARNLYRIL